MSETRRCIARSTTGRVIERDRIYAAALKANEKGLLTDEECSQFKD